MRLLTHKTTLSRNPWTRLVRLRLVGTVTLALLTAISWSQDIDQPPDVKKRTENGQLRELADLLQDLNPNYARLTFTDESDEVELFSTGWESWYSGSRFYVYFKPDQLKEGYLYLDGHCSWLVRNLNTLRDVSRSSMDQLNYGAFPMHHEGKFYRVGGYGFFRFHRNWYEWDPRGGVAIDRHDNDERDSLGYRPPNILHAFWRDDASQSFLTLGNAKFLDEPTSPQPDEMESRQEWVQKKLREYQVWRFPDKKPNEENGQLLHFRDINPEAFAGATPIGSVETDSWVIFILDDTYSTPALHKATLEWYDLKSEESLHFGNKAGLNGWVTRRDSLFVISDGGVVKAYDVNAHMQEFRNLNASRFEESSTFMLDPFQPLEGVPWWVWALIATGISALGIVILYQKNKSAKVEVKLNRISTQVEVLEAFSQRIFHSVEADDILWGIAAQSVESLSFDQCAIYTRSDNRQQWERRAVAQPNRPSFRESHVEASLAIDQGVVGRVGLRGQVELEKPDMPEAMYDSDFIKRSVMAVPVVCDGSVIGVMEAAFAEDRDFDSGQRKILLNVANLVGQKLGRSLSERKTLEFARFYEDNPSPVLRLSPEGLVLLTNDSARAHFGSSAIMGEMLQWHELVSAAGNAYAAGEPASLSASHRTRIYQVKLVPNVEFGFVNVYTYEVTELEQAKSRAQKAERAKADFLSVMSHEIRTPLNAILGLNEVMLLDNPAEDQKKQLKYIQYSGKHLLALVNDILNLEALDATNPTLQAKSFDLKKLVEQLLEGFDIKVQDRDNNLHLDWSPGVTTQLLGNRHWVTQMVNNLVDNALKFTSRGEVYVRVMEGLSPEMVLIEVEDSGVGIAEEHLARIMDPFEQILTGPKNTGEKGTGLGLAITKRLASLHGGKLTVQSTVGVGSKFTLALVLPSAPSQPAAPKKPEEVPAEPEAELLVLVVDDNPLNLMVAQKLVERLGHKVVTAVNGEDAVAQWKKEQPDVILMDLQMPVMDGMEATRTIRTQSKAQGLGHQRIVALTADAEASTRTEAVEAGMDEVIVKPADAITLHRVLHALPVT